MPPLCVVLSCILHLESRHASVQCSQTISPPKDTSEVGIWTINIEEVQPRGFKGYESMSPKDEDSEGLKDVSGVTAACFAVLMGLLTQVC